MLALLFNVLSVNAGDSSSTKFTNPVVSSINTGLKVYPNPASSYVIVSYTLKTAAPVLIEMMNMHGDVVKTAKINSQAGQQRLNITLADLSSGIYMVRIGVNGAVETKKLVVY